MGIELFLTVLMVMYTIGIACTAIIISVAKYPRVIKRGACVDLVSLMLAIGMLFWVVTLR